MGVMKQTWLRVGLGLQGAGRRFMRDERGLTVSAVILIGILVVAVAAFGLIAATKIGEAGTEVENVDFGGG
jgi:hypothetical protein